MEKTNRMDTNSPLISVVMPAYNVEPYIDEAVNSILNQSFQNLEFIIVDDASTDNTWAKIQSYEDHRIIALRNPTNLGNYPSRNIGMKRAKGKYIAVMDADDIAMPKRLEKQFKLMESNAELIVTGTNFQYSSHINERKMPSSHEDILVSLLQYFNFLHPSLMIRAEAIQELGGYDEEYKYASDYNLLCQLSFLGKIHFIDEQLMIYRMHPEQISKQHTPEQNKYANDIRKKFHMKFVNYYKSKEQTPVTLPEIGTTELGRIISLYTYARYMNDKRYEEIADKIIDVVYKIITTNVPVDKYEGICGIGYGFQYLLRNNLIEGDEDEVLEEIDNIIMDYIENNNECDRNILVQYLKDRIIPYTGQQSQHRIKITSFFNKYCNLKLMTHESF